MTAPIAAFDQAELLQLAIIASRNDDAGSALTYLKEAVSRADATAFAHFLLGAEYAQIQMPERAAPEMEAAIALDPSLSIARFQLGLLLLSCGNAPRALDILQPLADLGALNPLAQFGQGLTHLIHDQFADAMHCLTRGIELNRENAALSADMQKIIDEINNLPPDIRQENDADNPAENRDAHHIFISAYTRNDGH